jgi:hypothetical protein
LQKLDEGFRREFNFDLTVACVARERVKLVVSSPQPRLRVIRGARSRATQVTWSQDRQLRVALPDVLQDAVQFVQAVVGDDDAARAFAGVVDLGPGTQLFGDFNLEAAHVGVRGRF